MTAFLAIFGAAWREALHKRAVVVFGLLALVAGLLCVSLSFKGPEPEALLRRQAAELTSFEKSFGPLGSTHVRQNVKCDLTVDDIRRPSGDDDLPHGLEDGYAIELTFRDPGQFASVVETWRRLEQRNDDGPRRDVPWRDVSVLTEDWLGFLEQRFVDFGWSLAVARPVAGSDREFLVGVRTDHPQELRGGTQVGLFFGAVRFRVEWFSVAEILVFIQFGIADSLVGFFGMLVLLSTMSSSVTEMLHKGTLDLLLARPISRLKLLVFRWLAAVLFVLIGTGAIFGLSFVGLSLSSGYWNPWFLLCAVTATGIFAVLYPVALLAGIVTRNGNLATLAAIGAWGLSATVAQVKQMLVRLAREIGPEKLEFWQKTLDGINWILPKTADLAALNVLFLGRSNLSPEAYARVIEPIARPVDWTFAASTSALFAVLVFALAAWRFRKRDW